MAPMTSPKRRPKSSANPWPERLRKLRDKLDLTQSELAKRLRISQSQVASYETGKRRPTRPIQFLIELLENKKI